MFRTFIVTLLVAGSISAYAAEAKFPGVESLMNVEEQRAAGLDELTPRQIEALNAWIERYAAGQITAPSIAVPSIAAPSISAPSTVTAVNPTTNSPAQAPSVAPAAPVDTFKKAPDKIDFISRINGNFEGWSGRTRFTLENGQVWEQRRGGRWKVSLVNPEVHIKQNFMGAFEMEVLSEGRSIGVRRIK